MSTGLHRSSSRPLHEQARELIHKDITSGRFRPGDRLPTENEYASRFQISLNPVRAALQQLVQTGLIERINGRGTFVVDTKIANQMTLLSSCTESLRQQGLAFEVEVLRLAAARASDSTDHVRQSLHVRASAKLWNLRRLIVVEGNPAIILDTWLPVSAAPRLGAESGFGEGLSLYSYLSDSGIRLKSARARLDVEFADDEQSELLRLSFGTPLLVVNSVASGADGVPVEVSTIWYNSKRIALTFDREID